MSHIARVYCILGMIAGFTGTFFATTKWPFILLLAVSILAAFWLPPIFHGKEKSKTIAQQSLPFWQSPFPYLALLIVILLVTLQ